jgi:hypothetical protein
MNKPRVADETKPVFVVVHPLDAEREQKIDVTRVGPIEMTRPVRWSLLSLRVYLMLMAVLVTYRVVAMAINQL